MKIITNSLDEYDVSVISVVYVNLVKSYICQLLNGDSVTIPVTEVASIEVIL